jgi:branched-chain amino acid transport system permease protein
MLGSFRVPLLRSGFRMVVFSVVIMAVVLFYRKGILGDRELSLGRFRRRLSHRRKGGAQDG